MPFFKKHLNFFGAISRNSLYLQREYHIVSIKNMKDMTPNSTPERKSKGRERQERLYANLVSLLKLRRRYRGNDCSLPAMAAALGVSPRTLTQVVKVCTKSNFNGLVNSLRLQDACAMLSSSRYERNTIEEIALLTGFQSRQAFYLAFHRLYGCTPAAYRRLHRKS